LNPFYTAAVLTGHKQVSPFDFDYKQWKLFMNNLRRRLTLLVPVLITIFLTASAANAQDDLQFTVEEFTLQNGLTFLVVERDTAPVFSGYITVGVGSGNEKIGNIGSAHLLEHMMFKGSQDIGTTDWEAEKLLMAREDVVWSQIDQANQQTRYIKLSHPEQMDTHLKHIANLQTALDSLAAESSQYVIQNEFDRIYTRNGSAEFNATTGYDFTRYYVSLPSNRLELWFSMEAGRLRKLALREFFPERSVVSEERRQSVENSGDAKLFELLCATAFVAHPYQIFWEWQSEVNNLTRSDLQTFFDTYYTPQQMSVAIVGDVSVDEVRRLAEIYFGEMPACPLPEPTYTVEPQQMGERRVEVVFDAEPALAIAYHKTAFDEDDEATFNVIERLLGDGRTSRLYKTMVLQKQLCTDVSTYTFPGAPFGSIYGEIFCIDAYPKDGISTADVEKAIYEELEKLAAHPVADRELQKIKNQIDAEYIWASYSNIGLAGKLANAQNLAKDWRFMLKFRDNLKAVSTSDIQRVAGQYFTKDFRTVATLVPKPEADTAREGEEG
jgi:predicted Zn-dependent peptidase